MFALIGETLRRIRKEHGKTLEELGKEAGLGRGQLSRIENAHQEATLSTLAKILRSQGVSRREFFRRYELVEDEARALHPSEAPEASGAGAPAEPNSIGEGVAGVQGFFGNLGAFFRDLLKSSGPIAQGAVEVGELTVLFQVVPRSQVATSAAPAPSGPREPAPAQAPELDGSPSSPDQGTSSVEGRFRPRRGRPPGRASSPRPAE